MNVPHHLRRHRGVVPHLGHNVPQPFSVAVEVISQSLSSSSFRRHRLRSGHVHCIRTLDVEAELVLCSRVALSVRESWRNAQKPLRVSAWSVITGQRLGGGG